MICPNCMKDTVIKSKVGEVDESWDCSSCPWWHYPARGRTGMGSKHEYSPIAIILFLAGALVAFMIFVATRPSPEYVHNYFSSNGKCYDSIVMVGTSKYNTTKEIPCSQKPQ